MAELNQKVDDIEPEYMIEVVQCLIGNVLNFSFCSEFVKVYFKVTLF